MAKIRESNAWRLHIQIYFNTLALTISIDFHRGRTYKLKLGHRNKDRLYDYIHIWFEKELAIYIIITLNNVTLSVV